MSKTVLTLYRDFHDLYARANSNLSKGQAHDEANLKWNSMKKGGVLDQEAYNVEVNTLKSKLRKRKLTMFDFVNNKKQPCVLSTPQPHAPPDSSASTSISGDSTASKSVSSSAQTTSTTLTNPVTETDSSNLVENQAGPSGEASTETTNADELSVLEGDNDAATRDTPAQTKIKEELEAVNKQLVKLNEARNLGLGEETNAGLVKQIKDETAKKNALQRKLDLTEQWRKNSKRARDKKKTAIKNAEKDFPGLSERVNSSIYRESTGRPCLEEQYPNLHKDILEIATIGAAASDRRRQETFRSVKTLADLHNALSDLGYKISKRALYQRLLPKGVSATEAKKHVRTVPVRLIRPENNLRRKHPDRVFAAESYNSAFHIAEIIGPKASVAFSVDDKSSVRIGVTAAKEQRPMLMNMAVRVRLPDHDFVKGSRHSLTPSVMGINRLDERGKVSYSGETYIAVRSLKHNNSSAFSHHEDLLRAVDLFPEAFKTEGGNVKPIMIKGTDGGPDENPRFEKNIFMGCKTFSEFKMDLYIEVTNAPGLSAFNKVERKMFHLSKELTGVLLPHDTYGSHLDSGGKTVDTELEIKNFKAAGSTLCNIWEDLVIDGYQTVAEFIEDPPSESIKSYVPTAAFRDKHVFETQYMTCYMKCDNEECCEPYVTNIELLFPHRKISPIIPIKRDQFGICAEMREFDGQKVDFLSIEMRSLYGENILPREFKDKFPGDVPYDAFFPSLKDKTEKRCCKNCGKYHATLKSLANHKKLCKRKKSQGRSAFIVEDDSSDDDSSNHVVTLNSVSSDEAESEEEEDISADIVSMRPKFSVAVPDSFVDTILDLKEWLRNPWTDDVNDNNNS